MYSSGIQCAFMHRINWKHSNGEICRFYYVIWAPELRKPEKSPIARVVEMLFTNCLQLYDINWVAPSERARPGLSEYVWDI